MANETQTKYLLDESRMPAAWYNLAADLPVPPAPVLQPGTGQPVGPADLAPLFPMEIIRQEVTTEQYVEIPEAVQAVYRLWRPTPLYRAHRLEAHLGTPAKIFYKYEGTSPAGSHKPNTAIPQAYYNKQEGITRLTTETGAGQWGSALSMACAFFGIELKVYMVRISYEQKPYRRSLMESWGARCIASPSTETQAGLAVLEQDPESNGSLGIAISEAVEDAVGRDDTKYSLGSVLNHVLMHQTIIGQEAQMQMEDADAYPDIIFGCAGGGSNFAGLTFPFVKDKLARRDVQIVAVEPSACPTLTRGIYAYDFGDTGMMTPLVKMHTLGHSFIPAGIHAGGLRYHGMAPLVSLLKDQGLIDAVAYPQNPVFDAAITFGRTEGIVPAPESAHAIHATIQEALRCKEAGEAKTILFGLSGHGNFDLAAYQQYLAGNLVDYDLPESEIERALAELPAV